MSMLGRKSITLRLTLLFTAVSTGVLLLLGVVIAAQVERHFRELDTDLLAGKLALVSHLLGDTRSSNDLLALPKRLDDALVGHEGLSIAILNAKGEVVYERQAVDFPAPLLASQPPPAQQVIRWTDSDGQQFRGLSGRAELGIPDSLPLLVALATDLGHHGHFMSSFRQTLWTVVGVAALVSGLLGWIAARRGLSPLNAIVRNAAAITASRLNQRLPDTAIPDELTEVVRTLNEMLARLEDAFRRLSDFSSDLAHELRTPVSNLLTQTQVTLSRERTADEYREILASNAEEFERLSRTIADMLFLAKAENDLIVPRLEKVDLRAEADSLLEYYEALADESGIRLSIDGRATVSGDRLMLRRAIGNLLSNAFRHTPRGGAIDVRIGCPDDGTASIAIGNTGETIPEEHWARLFDRFYRADPARRHDGEGAGLGLAITRSIMRAHGGDAAVRSAEGVTTFVLRLPV